MLCFHMRWSLPDVIQTVGHSALKVTMLRHPLDQYLSMWEYYGLGRPMNGDFSIEEYVRDIEDLDRISARGSKIKVNLISYEYK